MKNRQRAKEILNEEGLMSLLNSGSNYIENKAKSYSSYPARKINKISLNLDYGQSIDIMKRDWDNLIILDACRYDIFKNIININGDLLRVVTPSSHSDEFIQANFNSRKLHDTIYISANPHADMTLDQDVFYKVITSYSDDMFFHREVKKPYEKVTEIALSSCDQHDNKKHIIHYMQPHTPYLGNLAVNIREILLTQEGVATQLSKQMTGTNQCNITREYRDLLTAAMDNVISDELLKTLYVENLRLVLSEVNDLINNIVGKTVITSDHGEMLGNPSYTVPRKRKYEHPPDHFAPELRTVPYLIIESQTRREVVSEKPKSNDRSSKQAVNEQIKLLGYRK